MSSAKLRALLREFLLILKKHSTFFILMLVSIAMVMMYENFATMRNITNVLRQNSMIGLVSIGMTFVIMAGGIDLSVPAVATLSGIVFAELNTLAGFAPAVIAGLFSAIAVGVLNGIIITRTRIAPFVVTLVMMFFLQGVIQTYTKDASILLQDSPAVAFIGREHLLGLPVQFIVFIILALVCAYISRWTVLGRHTLAVGGNQEAARAMGVKVDRIKLLCYTLCSFFAGMGGILLTARLMTAHPFATDGWDMQAIAAVVVGGTLLKGGKGSFIGTIFGVLIMGLVFNAINLQTNLSSWWQWIVRGAFLLVVVIMQGRMSREKTAVEV